MVVAVFAFCLHADAPERRHFLRRFSLGPKVASHEPVPASQTSLRRTGVYSVTGMKSGRHSHGWMGALASFLSCQGRWPTVLLISASSHR